MNHSPSFKLDFPGYFSDFIRFFSSKNNAETKPVIIPFVSFFNINLLTFAPPINLNPYEALMKQLLGNWNVSIWAKTHNARKTEDGGRWQSWRIENQWSHVPRSIHGLGTGGINKLTITIKHQTKMGIQPFTGDKIKNVKREQKTKQCICKQSCSTQTTLWP